VLEIAVYFERRSGCGKDYPIERWQTLARAFGVDKLYIIDLVRLPCFQPEAFNIEIVESLDDIVFSGDFVFVDNVCPPNRKPIELKYFNHPEDAIYVFGADSGGIRDINPKIPTERPGYWVNFATATHHGIWAEQAAAITLHERYDYFNADNR
jgi:hypothetical protein